MSDSAVSVKGDFIATTCLDYKICFFDKNGSLLWKFDTESPTKKIIISSDGEYILVLNGGDEKNNMYFLHKSGKLLWDKSIFLDKTRFENIIIYDVDMTPRGDFIVASFSNETSHNLFSDKNQTGLFFIDRSGKLLNDIDLSQFFNLEGKVMLSLPINEVATTSDGNIIVYGDRLLATGRRNNLSVIDRNNNLLFRYDLHEWFVDIIVIDDGHLILTTTDNPMIRRNFTIYEFALANKKPLGLNKNILTPINNTNIVIDRPRSELIVVVILISLFILGIVVRPYYKRAKLKKQMAKTPTDWCPHCMKFTGGAEICPHCHQKTLIEERYGAGKKVKKK